MTLPAEVVEALGPYLAGQRWYAGREDAPVVQVHAERALLGGDDGRRLHWAIVEAEGARYQLLIGEGSAVPAAPAAAAAPATPAAAPATPATIAAAGGRTFYDATADPVLMLGLFRLVTGQEAERVRPVGAEQSNTSLVYDDRVIVKVYRRLLEGENPDIEVTGALAAAGFEHVAAPMGSWRDGGVDLAFAQQFLAGGQEGWALAVAAVSRLCDAVAAEEPRAPTITGGGAAARLRGWPRAPEIEAAGTDAAGTDGAGTDAAGWPGDFGADVAALGRMTAEMHLALARAFPVDEDVLAGGWAAFVDDLGRRLHLELPAGADTSGLLARLRRVRRPGPALRVHGDFHLGQVMRTDERWYVLDFEGEPARPFEERIRPSSVAKDVAGMLRSFDYASRFALRGRPGGHAELDQSCAAAWERHHRAAYLDAYLATESIGTLLAGDGAPGDADSVLAAFEVDKALYELAYEQAYRPDWVDIPRSAIERIVARLS